MVTFQLILSSVRRQAWLYGLWIVALTMSVSGLMIIDIYRSSLSTTLREQGTKILTADVSLSTRRKLTETEVSTFKAAFPPGSRFAAMTEMFAMSSSEEETRLCLLRFIDSEYPLMGRLKISGVESHGRDLNDGEQVWVAPDLLALMNTKVGGKLKIGQVEFVIAGTIDQDSSQTFRIGNMAPRVYVHARHLAATGLVQYGSTFTDGIYSAWSSPVENIKTKLEQQLEDPALQITVPADLEQGSLRVLTRMLDYLGLVGLVTLALGWVGVYYLGRRWLLSELMSGGVLKALGLTSRDLLTLWLSKLTLILILGMILGGAVAWMASQLIIPLFKGGLPDDFHLVWTWNSTGLLFLVGPCVGWLLMLDPMERVARANPLQLIANISPPQKWGRLAFSLIAILGFLSVALTYLQARSWKISGTFLGALLGSLSIVAVTVYLGLMWLGPKREKMSGWLWPMVTALWTRRAGVTILLITVSALSSLLALLIPHLEKTIVGEFHQRPAEDRPILFLFDIQDDQLEPLLADMKDLDVPVSQKSPFIRARLVKVNGKSFERGVTGKWSTREEEVDARMRNRGVNLSYRAKLGPAERSIAGKEFEELSLSPPEVSIEQGYAERLGLSLQDLLTFDIQGVEIEGRIAQVREVDWDSFQPNFFMQFRDGVLNEAPKTWIVTLMAHKTLTPPEIQRGLAKKFPNVTSLNVNDTISTVQALVQRLAGGLKIASRLSLALGIFVFIMILSFQLLSSERDWIQLRRLGFGFGDLLKLQFSAYALMSLAGLLLGAFLSLSVCWILARWAFESYPRFDWPSLVVISCLTAGLSALALAWLSRWSFKNSAFKSRFDGL
ncbi:MAG: ABC transporter permease [Bdellovibrionales bacterium]